MFAVAVSIGLQFVLMYSFLSGYFGVVALSIADWIEIIIAGLAVFVVGIIGGSVIRRVTGEFD